jgi:hypothetical protein
MLRLIDVALARGPETLYRGVSLTAAPGERIGQWLRQVDAVCRRAG